MHLLRGLSVGLGINYSCAEQWRPIAEEALYRAGRLKGAPSELFKFIEKVMFGHSLTRKSFA